MDIPPSRMFLINKSLKVYQEKNPGAPVFDASQGDGGASLPGVPRAILERAAQMQIEHGTAYDMPYRHRRLPQSRDRAILEAGSCPRLGPGQRAGHLRRTRCAGQGLPGDAGPRPWPPGRCDHRLARAVDFLQLGALRHRGERALGARRPGGRLGLLRRGDPRERGLCRQIRAQNRRAGHHQSR